MTVRITVDAKLYEEHTYSNIQGADYIYNFANIPKGRIVLEVLMNGESKFKGRLNKK
jgi:hypothetical protein